MSCVKTIAAKHKTSAREIFSKMRRGQDFFVRFQVGEEPREIKIWQLKDLKCEPRKWGDIDRPQSSKFVFSRTEMVERLNAQKCARCGRTDLPCEIHHVRKIAEMEKAGLARYMPAARLRKRIVLCQPCHRSVHAGGQVDQRRDGTRSRGEPDALKGASPVRRGAEPRPH
ncbi:hypothetical protein J4T85_021965 (plasmid) [Sinorhizobium medicae]